MTKRQIKAHKGGRPYKLDCRLSKSAYNALILLIKRDKTKADVVNELLEQAGQLLDKKS